MLKHGYKVMLLALSMVTGWASANQLPAEIRQMLEKHRLLESDVSIWVQNVKQSQPIVDYNGEKSLHPASVMKVLTTAAGLIKMGADYQWQTQFYVDRMPDANGIVQGNLYVKGGGDPFLVEERLQKMLEDLRANGVRHITGDIVLDTSLYYLPPEARDTESFDGNKWSSYNAIPSPIMVNFRTIKIQILPQEESKTVELKLHPQINNWRINNELTISNGSCKDNYSPSVDLQRDAQGYADLLIKGKYSLQCGPREMTVVMGEASEQFYYLFRDMWYALGGSFDGGGRIDRVPAHAKLISTGYSLPLSNQIEKMNQLSNNVMTRQLMLTLGAYTLGAPGSLEKGQQAVKQTLEEFGVPMHDVVIENGSGLSRIARVSAKTLATLLQKVYLSSEGENFLRSLAVTGESGTLSKRFRGGELAGKVYGKTGTIDNGRAFAGYVRARSGNIYTVVVMGNGKGAIKSRELQDDVLKWAYEQ